VSACPADTTSCLDAGNGQACTSTQSDPGNCSACAHRCPASQTCVAGACVCPSGLTACPGVGCSDLGSSAACGACGHACGSEQSCVAGQCVCPAGQVECSPGVCVDLQSSAEDCGVCGHACPAAQGCSKGACVDLACNGLAICDCGVEVVALTEDAATRVDTLPSINASGTVAYTDGSSVISWTPAGATRIGLPPGLLAIPGTVSINGSGQIAVFARAELAQMGFVYRTDGQTLVEVDAIGDGSFLGSSSIDGAGKVAFGFHHSKGLSSDLYVSDGATRTLIEETRDLYATGPISNDAGRLVFALDDGGGLDIFLTGGASGREAVAVFDADDAPFAGPALNDQGTVAFLSSFPVASGARAGGLFTKADGAPSLRALLPSSDYQSAMVALDETGTVAVRTSIALEDRQSFEELALVLPDGSSRPVLRTGDSMFRSIVTSIVLSPFGFRGRGQLVFSVGLDDGRSAIVRACITPSAM
jgi:hypothetical protein